MLLYSSASDRDNLLSGQLFILLLSLFDLLDG